MKMTMKAHWCCPFLIILLDVAITYAFDAAPSLDVKLLRHLTQSESYDIRSRPVVNHTHKVHVGISIEINRINHLDDKTEVFSWVGYANVTWNNPHLRWDPEKWGGIEYLLLKEKDMWVPDISILERLDDDVGFSDQKRRLITVTYHGDVKWFLGGGMLDTPCKLNMRKFPFDSQICGMSVGSYAMSDKEVEILHSNATMIGETLGKHGMWTVTDFNTSMRVMTYTTKTGNISYKYVYLRIYLRRRPSYYIINIMLPCLFVSVLICVVFMIPPDGGDKLAFSITLLVAFNVIQLLIIDMMPRTSESVPIIAIYVNVLFALSASCIPLSVFVITVHHQGDRYIPRFIARLIFPENVINHHHSDHHNDKYANYVASNSDHQTRTLSTEVIDNEHLRLLEEIRLEVRRLRMEHEERSRDCCRSEVYRHVANRIDNILLKIFAPLLVLHTFVCLGFMIF